MKYLICGLGNIGESYELTRHNAGFLIIDRLVDLHKLNEYTDHLALKSEMKYKARTLHFIKPTTYMNRSGKALSYWMQKLTIQKENILIIMDDTALPFSVLRLRPRGSSGGHNGLKSIEQVLHGNDFARLRVGVGHDFTKNKQADYVLEPFKKEELLRFPPVMDKAIEIIFSFCSIGVEHTMNLFNKKTD